MLGGFSKIFLRQRRRVTRDRMNQDTFADAPIPG
jgi:hypothetical protein